MSKKKVKSTPESGMPQPDKLLQDLSGKSHDEGQSIDEWIEWLEWLQNETRHWLTLARHDRDEQESD
jgi:hypothetical protein